MNMVQLALLNLVFLALIFPISASVELAGEDATFGHLVKDLFSSVQHEDSFENESGEYDVSEMITGALGKIRKLMREGNTTYHIPPVDPYPFNMSQAVNSSHLELDGIIGGKVSNLSNLSWDNIFVCPLTLAMQMRFVVSNVWVNGLYKLDGNYYGILPLYGEGNFSAGLDSFKFTATVQIHPRSGNSPAELKLLEITLHDFKGLKVDFENILGEGSLSHIVNSFATDMLPTVVERTIGYVEKSLSETLFKVMEHYLAELTVLDCINYLTQISNM